MLLHKRFGNNHLAWIGLGEMFLVIGLVAHALIHPTTDFAVGFFNGLSGACIGVSIVFNTRGVYLVGKKSRAETR